MKLPSGLGVEAAGVVTEAGSKVRDLKSGDRMAYADNAPGAYAEERIVDASCVVKLPDGIAEQQAAAMMLKGLTAWFLLRRCDRVRKGDSVLLHAATGGVGLIALQWATALGAKVIAVVGSDAKADVACEYGAAAVIVGTWENVVTRVREVTKNRGGPVVYNGVGKDTFFISLDYLRPRGLMVSYGNASGPVPPVLPLELSKRGSLYLTRPALFQYIAKASDCARRTGTFRGGHERQRQDRDRPVISVIQCRPVPPRPANAPDRRRRDPCGCSQSPCPFSRCPCSTVNCVWQISASRAVIIRPGFLRMTGDPVALGRNPVSPA